MALVETMASELLFKESNLWSASLAPGKHWYILMKAICGTRLKDFAKSDIFRRFPGEIQSRSGREVVLTKSAFPTIFNRMPSTVYVVSTFGLFAGLLRQKDIPADSLISSQAFKSVINTHKPPCDRLPLCQPGERQAERNSPKEQETEKKETTQERPSQVRLVSPAIKEIRSTEIVRSEKFLDSGTFGSC